MAKIGTKNSQKMAKIGAKNSQNSPPIKNASLLFWERSAKGQAEVDFVTVVGSQIIPVEVKSGSTGSLRSLQSFLMEKKCPLGVRISEHSLSLHENILSMPFYLIGFLDILVKQALNQLAK